MNHAPTKYESNLYFKNKGGLDKSSPYNSNPYKLNPYNIPFRWYGLIGYSEDSGAADFAGFEEIENLIRFF